MLDLRAVANVDARLVPAFRRFPERRHDDDVRLERIEVRHPHCRKLAKNPPLTSIRVSLSFEGASVPDPRVAAPVSVFDAVTSVAALRPSDDVPRTSHAVSFQRGSRRRSPDWAREL